MKFLCSLFRTRTRESNIRGLRGERRADLQRGCTAVAGRVNEKRNTLARLDIVSKLLQFFCGLVVHHVVHDIITELRLDDAHVVRFVVQEFPRRIRSDRAIVLHRAHSEQRNVTDVVMHSLIDCTRDSFDEPLIV